MCQETLSKGVWLLNAESSEPEQDYTDEPGKTGRRSLMAFCVALLCGRLKHENHKPDKVINER